LSSEPVWRRRPEPHAFTLLADFAAAAGTARDAGTGLTPEIATGSGTGQAAGISIVASAGLATGTGIARDAEITSVIVAGLATGTGTSQGTGTGLTPGLAIGTGSARDVSVVMIFSTGLAASEATAGAYLSMMANTQAAMALATALSPRVQIIIFVKGFSIATSVTPAATSLNGVTSRATSVSMVMPRALARGGVS
jgi:hypothetical protein